MIKTVLSVRPSAIRRGLLCIALMLGACAGDADLGDVVGETDGSGETDGTDGSTVGEEETGTSEIVIGGCERVAADPEDSHSWALVCGTSGQEELGALTVTPSGDLLVAIDTKAMFVNPALAPIWNIGGEEFSPTRDGGALLLRLDPTGALLWHQYFEAPNWVRFDLLESCGDGFLAVGDASSVDFGDGEPQDGDFFARFAADGTLQWKRPLERSTDPLGSFRVVDLDCDADGNIAMLGASSYGVDFGEGLIPSKATDTLVAKFEPDGELLFAKMLLGGAPPPDLGAGGHARPGGVAAHDDGSTFVVVNHDSELDFGSGPIQAGDEEQSLLVRLSETGELLWYSEIFGIGAEAGGVTVDEAGRAIVSGIFLESIELGGQTYENVFPIGQQNVDIDGFVFDTYIAAFEADGTYAWGEALGWMEDEEATVVRFSEGQAWVHRSSVEQSSLSAHGADGSEVLFAEQDGNANPYSVDALRASDESFVQGMTVSDNTGWPFDLGAYATGETDIVVVNFEL